MAFPPHRAPPLSPKSNFPSVLGGIYFFEVLIIRNFSFTNSEASADRSVLSDSVNTCLEKGSGLSGYFWVGKGYAPESPSVETGRSSTENNEEASSLSRTYISPSFFAYTKTSFSFPLCLTVVGLGRQDKWNFNVSLHKEPLKTGSINAGLSKFG